MKKRCRSQGNEMSRVQRHLNPKRGIEAGVRDNRVMEKALVEGRRLQIARGEWYLTLVPEA